MESADDRDMGYLSPRFVPGQSCESSFIVEGAKRGNVTKLASAMLPRHSVTVAAKSRGRVAVGLDELPGPLPDVLPQRLSCGVTDKGRTHDPGRSQGPKSLLQSCGRCDGFT